MTGYSYLCSGIKGILRVDFLFGIFFLFRIYLTSICLYISNFTVYIPYMTTQILCYSDGENKYLSKYTVWYFSHKRHQACVVLYRQSRTDFNCTNSQFINIMNGKEINQILPVGVTIWKIDRMNFIYYIWQYS